MDVLVYFLKMLVGPTGQGVQDLCEVHRVLHHLVVARSNLVVDLERERFGGRIRQCLLDGSLRCLQNGSTLELLTGLHLVRNCTSTTARGQAG